MKRTETSNKNTTREKLRERKICKWTKLDNKKTKAIYRKIKT